MEAQDLGRQRIEAGYAGHCLPKHVLGNGLRRWFSGKGSVCQCKRCRRHGFSPRDGKILWRRKWHPSPVFLPGKIPWTEEPDSFQSMGSPRVRHNEPLSARAHTHTYSWKHHCPGRNKCGCLQKMLYSQINLENIVNKRPNGILYCN